MTACPACGSALVPDSRFCGQCGHVLTKPVEQELTRRIPTTIDEATADPPEVRPPHVAKPTLLGSSDLSKTVVDNASVDRILAGLQWEAAPSEAKVPIGLPTALGIPAVPPPDAPTVMVPTVEAPTVVLPSVPEEPATGTALGMPVSPGSAPGAPPPAPAEPARAPRFGATMIGGSITAADVMAESTRRLQAPPPERLKTMVGHAAIDGPAPPPAPDTGADPQAYRPAFKTMMGVALPGIAPIRDSERSLQGAAPVAPTQNMPARGPMQTLHGGIAAPASQPRLPQPPVSNRGAPPAPMPVPPIVPAPGPLQEEPLPAAPRPLEKKGVSAVVVVAIIAAVLVLSAAVAAVFLLRAGAPLTAKARLDESGKESLEIRCESCPNETKITLGASSASVTDASALLPLAVPLKIGENDLDIAIDRPGAGRDETVKVHVPIAYRVKADLTTLAAVPPVVTVRVEAAPGTEVIVDEKPVALDASGKGNYALDVSADALGASDEQKAIDRKIPFSVKRKGAAVAEPGTLIVRAAIVPLHMDAPGAELFTANTTTNIVGQTKPGGTVTVDGQNVPLDATGRFAIRAELPSEGEKTLTIVANAPPLAPRTIRAKVTRVASLEAQTKIIDTTTPLGFDAYGTEPASKVGSMVTINGEILEIRNSPGYAVMIVEEKKSCAAGGGCILRLSIGEDVRAARGDTIRAYGHVTGAVAWSNKSVPAVTGTLAITAKAGKK